MIEVSITKGPALWNVTIDALEGELPVSADGDSAEEATEAALALAAAQVEASANAEGVTITPFRLAMLELRLRRACSLARQRLAPISLRVAPSTFGEDISTFPDLDAQMRPLRGQRAVGEAVARLWLTPSDSLAWAPGLGVDLRDYLGAAISRQDLYGLEARLAQAALSDERVQGATVKLEVTGSPGSLALRVEGRIVTAEGPFRLVLSVDRVAADLSLIEAR